jgi:hypothetical protein
LSFLPPWASVVHPSRRRCLPETSHAVTARRKGETRGSSIDCTIRIRQLMK